MVVGFRRVSSSHLDLVWYRRDSERGDRYGVTRCYGLSGDNGRNKIRVQDSTR